MVKRSKEMLEMSTRRAVRSLNVLLVGFLLLALSALVAKNSAPARLGGLLFGWGAFVVLVLYSSSIVRGILSRRRHYLDVARAVLIYLGIAMLLFGADVQLTPVLLRLDERILKPFGAKSLLLGVAALILGGAISFGYAAYRAVRFRLENPTGKPGKPGKPGTDGTFSVIFAGRGSTGSRDRG
jgi:hypothetical protein